MLRFLRKSVKSLAAKILIGLLVASFAVWGIGDIFSFRLDSKVARVGDTEITADRFAIDLRREQSRLSGQLGELITYDMMRAAGLDRRILGDLVRQAAYREELHGLGLEAPDDAVADAIRTDSAFQDPVTGKFSQQSYQFVLGRMGLSAKAFEEHVRDRLGRKILDETAKAAVTPPPGLGARIAAWQGEERTVTTLTLPLDMAPDPGLPDEATLTKFHDTHENMFTEPERRSGEYLHVNAAKLMETLKPDEAAARTRYEATKDRYTVTPSRTVDQITFPDHAAEAALGRLLSGDATFEALGAEQGIEADSLSLGKVTPDDLPPAAAKIVFGTTEPGIVGPVELPAGSAIFRITNVTKGGLAPFDEVRDMVASEMARDALLDRAPEIANQIEELRAEGLTFAEIAKRTGVDYGTFEGLARDGTLPDGGKAEGVVASDTFLTETFAALDAEERDLIETPKDGYILMMVRKIAPSEVLPLDAVRDRAIAAWQTAERRKAIAARAAKLAAQLGQDASIWDIGEELGLTAKQQPPFTVLTSPAGLPADLVKQQFRAPLAGGASALTDDKGAAIVGQVSDIAPLSPEAIASNAAEVNEKLTASLKLDVGEYFARAIEARHPATYDPAVIDDVFRRLGANVPAGQ